MITPEQTHVDLNTEKPTGRWRQWLGKLGIGNVRVSETATGANSQPQTVRRAVYGGEPGQMSSHEQATVIGKQWKQRPQAATGADVNVGSRVIGKGTDWQRYYADLQNRAEHATGGSQQPNPETLAVQQAQSPIELGLQEVQAEALARTVPPIMTRRRY